MNLSAVGERATRPRLPPLSFPQPSTSERPAISGDGAFVAFGSDATNLVAADTNNRLDVFVVTWRDTDGDGVENMWEQAFGFNPFSVTDGAGDTDGDGTSNRDEFLAKTHPGGLAGATRYFAEGATGFFETRVSLANPGD